MLLRVSSESALVVEETCQRSRAKDQKVPMASSCTSKVARFQVFHIGYISSGYL